MLNMALLFSAGALAWLAFDTILMFKDEVGCI
jgi:hypothetical protein